MKLVVAGEANESVMSRGSGHQNLCCVHCHYRLAIAGVTYDTLPLLAHKHCRSCNSDNSTPAAIRLRCGRNRLMARAQ